MVDESDSRIESMTNGQCLNSLGQIPRLNDTQRLGVVLGRFQYVVKQLTEEEWHFVQPDKICTLLSMAIYPGNFFYRDLKFIWDMLLTVFVLLCFGFDVPKVRSWWEDVYEETGACGKNQLVIFPCHVVVGY